MTTTNFPVAYGRYELLASIGSGGVAEVFKAKSFGVEGFEKTLVIKRLHAALANSLAFRDVFVREAQRVVRLSHANVIQVFDVGRVEAEAGPSYFTAMEYVAGLPFDLLLDRLRLAGELPPPQLSLHVAAEVAKALDHAHRRRDEQLRPLGMVHGDVAAHNVFVSWEGEVKLGDFGIARAVLDRRCGAAVRPSLLARTLVHSSPEQARGEPVGPSSDVFSLGTLLYEALAGAPPFQGDDPDELRERVGMGRIPALDRVRAGLAPALPALVSRLTAPDPAERPESAARCHEELLACQYASGARFGASELRDLVERFREPVAKISNLEGALARGELASSPPGSGARPASGVSPASRRSLPPPPEPPPLRDWIDGEVREEVSVLALRWGGRAPVTAAARERARQILLRYGAQVLAESSRELSAIFGLQQADGRDTENAVRCGLVLVRGLAVGGAAPFVGIDAGTVRVRASRGASEDETSRALVERARHLAGVAAERVVISREAAPHLRGLFALELPPPPAPDDGALMIGGARAPHEVYGRFVGRKLELRALGEALSAASRRALAVVIVSGDYGVGKTRLLHEMERRIERGSFNIGCYLATCPPEGRGVPMSGLVAMLRVLCGVREGDSPERIAAVAPRLRALGLREDEVGALLAELGVARPEGAHAAPLSTAMTRMIASLCDDRVHVFAWDNAHALDAMSASVISAAIEQLPQARALLVFAVRPGGEPQLPGAQRLSLGDLEDDDVLRLIGLRVGAKQLPETLVEFVRARAGGHPMFIEALLNEALESGAIVVSDERIQALNLSGALAVPRPLRTLLGDQVRRLTEPERNLLLAAATLGDPVDVSVLASMLEGTIGTVNSLVEALEARDLVVRDGPVTISFRSPLLPEVVQGDVSPELRRELHRQAANTYQMVLGERTEELASYIAHHLAEAGEHERAAGFFATSGLHFLAVRRLNRAVRDLSSALELVDLDGRTGEELSEWVGALSSAVRHVRAGAALPRLVERIGAYLDRAPAIDGRARVQITIDAAQLAGVMHRHEQARALLARAGADAAEWPDLSRVVFMTEAEIAIRNGEFRTAVAAVERAAALPEGDTHERHRLLVATAQALGGVGEHERAFAALDEAATLVPEDPVALTERAKVRALIFGFRGDWRACGAECERAVEQCRSAGLVHEAAVNLHNLGDALMRQGELPRAYATLEASRATAEEVGAERLVNLNRLMLAFLDGLNGSASAERSLIERLAHAEARRWTWDVMSGRYLLGRLLARRGELAGARRELTAARDEARVVGHSLVAADCERALAELD